MDVREVAEMLMAQGKRVSVAEADTAGLVGYLLGTIPGSSQFFPGGVIAYTGGLKQSILGVSDDLYNSKGSVCEEMAIAMDPGRPGADRHRLRRIHHRGNRAGPGTFLLPHRHLLHRPGRRQRQRRRHPRPV